MELAKNMSNEPEICAKCEKNYDPSVYPAGFLARFNAANELCPVCMREKLLKSYFSVSGAYIAPLYLPLERKFVWVITGLEDDSFVDGEAFYPAETAASLWGLMDNEKYE